MCAPDETCQNHHCIIDVVECVPRCGLRQCGDDGCGGNCGICKDNEFCNMINFQCLPSNNNVVHGKLYIETLQHSFDEKMRLSLSDNEILPAKGLTLTLIDKDGTKLAATVTRSNGAFYLYPERPPLPDDKILIAASWLPEGSLTPKLVALKADLSPDKYILWTWSLELKDFAYEPLWGKLDDITIKMNQASGALFIFMYLKDAMKTTLADLYLGNPEKLPALAVVWKEGIKWQCGTCFVKMLPQSVGGQRIAEQTIFIGGDPKTESAWGFPTILHEFGHYLAALARDDSKGGKHFLGELQVPPFAWSEGWASFFAVMTASRSEEKPQPVYWRKLENVSFWIDYSTPVSSLTIQKPDINLGIDQKLDETWVTHMLWDMWDGDDIPEISPVDDGIALGTKTMLAALFQQRYLKKDRGAKGVDFVDYVDAILCMYPDLTDKLTKMINQIQNFPYDGKPLCN